VRTSSAAKKISREPRSVPGQDAVEQTGEIPDVDGLYEMVSKAGGGGPVSIRFLAVACYSDQRRRGLAIVTGRRSPGRMNR
jgi:hypothetical protein